ncbi:hypothetical protein FSP39_002026 [Pinctada imbricata]|uniref:RING finger protein 141 n=1 Tax=Pinctada imbricata TaxID=66713 RepID=A0AA89C9N2_PINIB|nr:hypothetical protein FSP39_002026 [Pinctada imbricata]
MGQGKSLPDPEHAFDVVHGKLKSQLHIIRRLAALNYAEFKQSVEELNKITSTFSDQRGKQLKFFIKEGTDSTIFWKPTVRIGCEKVNTRLQCIESTCLLNLKQYIVVYKEITDQVENLSTMRNEEHPQSSLRMDICASAIFENLNIEPGMDSLESIDSECCICMENKSEVILPCTHQFCESCIDRWNVTSKTCPICRAKVNSTDDTWVLTEKPDNTEYASEVKGYLVSLADRHGHPSPTKSDKC